MQQFPCPACGKTISADVPPGKAVQCPLCQQVVNVPLSDGPTLPGTPPPPIGGGPMPMQYGVPPQHPKSQGMAVASLVSGISSIVVCPGIAAIVGLITGVIALVRANREPENYGGTGMAIGGIVTSGLGLLIVPLMISILLPSLSRARELSKRTVCAANMRMIGQSLYIYSQSEPDFAFPDDIAKLQSTGFAGPQMFQCPSAPQGQQCYYYVPGLTANSDPSAVLLFEDPLIHQGEGGNVLYQDGRVQFVQNPQFQQIVDDHIDVAQ